MVSNPVAVEEGVRVGLKSSRKPRKLVQLWFLHRYYNQEQCKVEEPRMREVDA